MPLGWEIDNELWIFEPVRGNNEHLARNHLAPLAGAPIKVVVRWEGLLELKGDTLAHDTDGIDGVDEGVDVRVQDVSLRQFNHLVPLSNTTNSRQQQQGGA